MKELVIGTGNKGKVKEFEELFVDIGLRIRGLNEFNSVDEPIEDGTSFEENADKKARSYALALGTNVLADDSGLCVDFLDGEPGVYSARFAGENSSDAENIEKLLKKLKNVPDSRRTARFVCVISIANENGMITHQVKGTCEGHIAHKPFGFNGFGYDPVFIPNGYKDSFGIIDSETKHRLSHRASAARKIKAFLRK